MSIRKGIVLRVRIAFLLTLVVAGAVIYRMATIQVVEGEQWIKKGEERALRVRDIPATRGNIFSADGRLLATSLPFYQLALDPSVSEDSLFLDNIDSLAIHLAAYYKDKPWYTYKKMIQDARQADREYLKLNKKEIGFHDKKLMERWPLLKEGQLRGGVIFEKVEKRFLPFSRLGYRTIGMLDENSRGIVGLEYSFNKQLAGVKGQAVFQKMSGGGWKPLFDGSESRPEDGHDIQTTIDIDIQDVTESSLLKELKKHDADYGLVVVMEVETGEIKAISNLSKGKSGKYFERYNYAVGSQGSREPGSTFKLASVIALLEETDVELGDTIDTGSGELVFFDKTMRDHKPGGFGKLTVKEVFEKSSNIGVAKLVSHYFNTQPEKFYDYLNKMHLDKPLNFQMVGEGRPYIKHPSDTSWTGVTLPWMSYGYELKMTPLHMLTLYNAVANDGEMVKPRIVKRVMKANKVLEEYEKEVLVDQICSKSTLKKVREMMEGVVERGTASNINESNYKIAGKTGTAKNVRNGRYVKEYYTSFVGYFPAEKPKYSCIVVIDNPKGYQIYGSDVSAPVFKEIADQIYSLELDLHEVAPASHTRVTGVFPYIRSGRKKELTMICNELGISNHTKAESEWVTTEVVNDAVYWEENKIERNLIPDVRGMSLRDAIYLLENQGIRVISEGRGRVQTQSMTPGQKVNGGTIKLVLS